MEDIIAAAKAEFVRAQGRITNDLAATPDDKINWSPSNTARTPLQLVAHAAMGTQGIAGLMAGEPFQFDSMADMDAKVRVMEKEFDTRDKVIGLLEKTSSDYLKWLDGLTAEQVAGMAKFPFAEVPMAIAITIPADHLRAHAAQLEYLQTIYGDFEMRGM